MAEESEGLTQENAWLRAYLETLVYHEETFKALKRLEVQIYWQHCAIEAMHDDLDVLLRRTYSSFWSKRIEQLEWYTKHLEWRLNEEVTAPDRKPKKEFKGSEI